MVIRALHRKLLRDLLRLRGQVITISLVVACGVASYVALDGTYRSLEREKHAFYERYRFADVFATLERAPARVHERLEALEGVARVYTRVVETVMLPLETLPEPAVGHVVSLPPDGAPPLNDVYLKAGRMLRPGRSDEVLLLESFANAHDLEVGDTVPAVINGTLRSLRIVGIAMSPEYVFPMPQGGITPDPKRFAVLWMSRPAVAAAFDMDGAFDDVAIDLQPGASEKGVISALDRVLEPYGIVNAVGRDKQLSNYVLSGELSQLEQQATVVPAIFLGVAAFLLNVVLSRLIRLQRPEIAALKALGYADLDIGMHFLKLVSLIALLGAAIGIGVGAWIGGGLTSLYTEYFRFPDLEFQVTLRMVLISTAVSIAAATLGAWASVRSVVRLPPAEAMRPPAPASYRIGWLERRRGLRWLGTSAMMVFREVRRRPARTFLSALGIAMAVAILVTGRFFQDSWDYLIDLQFHRTWREDITVQLLQPEPLRVVRHLEHLPGVLHAEGVRNVPVRFRAGHLYRDGPIIGIPEDARLRRVLDSEGDRIRLPEQGILLTRKLGEILGIETGDTVRIEARQGDRRVRDVRVSALVDEAFGLQGHMPRHELNELLGEPTLVSTVVMSVDPRHYDEIFRRLKNMPQVGGVTRKDNLIARFRQQSGEMMLTMTLILTIFAATIAIGVVYNNARVALSMRSRDLASLRVLGFTRGEISTVLLGELAVQVALAIPLGLVIGRWMAAAVMSTVDPENYRFPLVISSQTYAFAAAVTLASAVFSAMLVRRRLDRLDLIGVLKTRE